MRGGLLSVSALWATGVRAVPTASSLFADLDLSTLTRLPLWEPTLEEYFPAQRGGERDANGLPSPVVLTNPSNEEFVYHARKGYPIMVSDWADGMKFSGWTGADFAREFPFGYMKAEYILHMSGFREKDHDIKRIDGELRFNLGNFKPDKKTPWHNYTRQAAEKYKDDPLKPKTGPYVWHVKDELTPQQKEIVQARFESPHFLKDPLNSAYMNRTFEVWFSPGKECGAGAHADGYCDSVVSVQLRGDKRWRKMMMPKMTILDSFDEFDGGVYEAEKWEPDLGFVNTEKSAVIWPPGYLHETSTVQTPDGSCGAAITLQYAFPQPVQFLRAYLPRLQLSAEVGHCVASGWTQYAVLFVKGIKATSKMSKMQTQLATILGKVDANKDDQITVEEVRSWFTNAKESSAYKESFNYPREHQELFFQLKAEDTVAYHDMNGDMIVSRQELWDSLVQWNVVRIHAIEGLKIINKVDRKGLEAFESSFDYLRREPVKLPDNLRPELEELFTLKKGTTLFKSLKGITSFSDGEFYSRLRDVMPELLMKQQREL